MDVNGGVVLTWVRVRVGLGLGLSHQCPKRTCDYLWTGCVASLRVFRRSGKVVTQHNFASVGETLIQVDLISSVTGPCVNTAALNRPRVKSLQVCQQLLSLLLNRCGNTHTRFVPVVADVRTALMSFHTKKNKKSTQRYKGMKERRVETIHR